MERTRLRFSQPAWDFLDTPWTIGPRVDARSCLWLYFKSTEVMFCNLRARWLQIHSLVMALCKFLFSTQSRPGEGWSVICDDSQKKRSMAWRVKTQKEKQILAVQYFVEFEWGMEMDLFESPKHESIKGERFECVATKLAFSDVAPISTLPCRSGIPQSWIRLDFPED